MAASFHSDALIAPSLNYLVAGLKPSGLIAR